MKKDYKGWFLVFACLCLAPLFSCGGGDGGDGGGSSNEGSNALKGTVREWVSVSEKRPLGGATVSVAGKSTVSKSNGDYGLYEIPSGTYQPRDIKAEKEGNDVARPENPLTFSGNTHIFWNPVLYPAINTLEGRVQLAVSQTEIIGLAGAVVSITETGMSTVSDGNGYYDFRGIPNGTYAIKFDAGQYGVKTYNMTFLGTSHLSWGPLFFAPGVSLNTLSGITLKQTAEGNVPFGGVTITVVGTGMSTVSDENGKYDIFNVPTGSFEILAEKPEHRTQKINLTFSGCDNHQWDPILTPTGGTLYGVIKERASDGSERVLGNVKVTVEFIGKETLSSADGKYSISGIPPGQYRIWATKESYREEATSLSFSEGDWIVWNPVLIPSS